MTKTIYHGLSRWQWSYSSTIIVIVIVPGTIYNSHSYNILLQLNKLPELANSVKRRMSSHVKPKTSLTTDSPPVMASPHGLNNDDDDDDDVIIGDSDIAAEVKVAVMRRPTIAMPDSCGGGGGRQPGSRNHTGAVYVLSRKRKQFQIKWSILGNGSLRWFNEQTSLAIPKETIQLSHVFREPTTRQQQQQRVDCGS